MKNNDAINKRTKEKTVSKKFVICAKKGFSTHDDKKNTIK